jgi:hypothetical protein
MKPDACEANPLRPGVLRPRERELRLPVNCVSVLRTVSSMFLLAMAPAYPVKRLRTGVS